MERIIPLKVFGEVPKSLSGTKHKRGKIMKNVAVTFKELIKRRKTTGKKLTGGYIALGVTIDQYLKEGDELVLHRKDGSSVLIPVDKLIDYYK